MKSWKRFLPLTIVLVVFVIVILSLNGFEAKYPSQAVDGTAWDENWTMLGAALGVEEPGNGFVLLDNNTALAADDTYLATWVSGEAIPYINADGDDTEIYKAQIYLLLMGCKNEDSAQANVGNWIARTNEIYAVSETRTENCNGQEYTVSAYQCGSDTNPYSRGVSAFTVFENYAVSVELNCLEEYTGDEAAILIAFLTGCHYSADIGA